MLALSIMLIFTSNLEADASDPEIRNAVVTIYTTDPRAEQLYRGTGFVVDQSGIIVTNFHVVSQKHRDKNSPLLIVLEDGAFFARILSFDIKNDIALLKVEARKFRTIELDERHSLKQGEAITVIGSPSSHELTVSNGNISNIFGMNELIQITAPVTYGSSGSPVLNSKGKAIGIVTFFIEDGKNLNFALHIRHVARLLEKTKKRQAN